MISWELGSQDPRYNPALAICHILKKDSKSLLHNYLGKDRYIEIGPIAVCASVSQYGDPIFFLSSYFF
jgi:hypothetical protein